MRRVYLMYCGRQVCKPIPRIIISLVLLLAIVGSVSILNIAANLLNTGSVTGLVRFLVTAFTEAEVLVQALALALVAMLGWAGMDIARNTKLVTYSEPL